MNFASVEHEGITVESNTETEAQMRASLGVDETPGETAAPEHVDEAAPANETAEQKAARERDEKGRFAKTSEEKPDKTAKPQAGAVAPDVQKRFDRLTWEREEATRRADRAERELAEARAGRQPERREAQPSQPQRFSKEDLARYKAMPDAPKDSDYDDFGDYTMALALFAQDKRFGEQQAGARRVAAQHDASREADEATRGYVERVQEAVKADPQFFDNLHPEVIALRPISQLTKDERPGPLNVLAEYVMRSKYTTAVMKHLSAHPDLLRRFEALHPRQFPQEFADLVADSRQDTAPVQASVSKTPAVSQAKPPVKAVTATPVVGDQAPGDDADDEAHLRYWNTRDKAARATRR